MLEMASSVAKTSMSVAQGMCSLPRLLGKIYKTPVWQNSLFTHSVASFMKFDLGKASVKKKNQTSGFYFQQVAYNLQKEHYL